ncbi:MAG TPA: isoprenyl transferase [Terrimesophilobacter sp.]|nr:isoprenyl transferase [Terrimesophilobacter sp.]
MRKREKPFGSGILYGLYQTRLRREIAELPVPGHIAIILDGNRRWARANDLETAGHGYRAGAAKFREFLVWCDDLGVKVTTLYLLSTDNLIGRPPDELADLFEVIADLADDLSHYRDWKVQHVGSEDHLPDALQASLNAAEARTANNTGMHINLAIGYGGRREIADAMRSIVREHAGEGKSIDALAEILTPELIAKHLYTGGQPDPDLVIRTSGEQRMSDFMLWQSAYSEFYFVEALGPDLREVDFLRAVRDYAGRQRRFGQ